MDPHAAGQCALGDVGLGSHEGQGAGQALAGFAQPEPVLRARRAGGVLRCAASREFASRPGTQGQSQVDGLGVVLLAETVLGEAECRGEFLERLALGALADDEGGGGFLGEPGEFSDGDDEVGGRGVRVVRLVEQFLGAGAAPLFPGRAVQRRTRRCASDDP
ncbi:hypothetical protein AB0L39_29645 [Streptomyces parvus]|uniref:hypothetical protein n=1 Tax=Streptomyces parvus TaxID=66428 RepID=UPI003426F16B